MGRITWDLIRKKTEHHDGLLEELEELSLHQLSLEKLEVIGRACPRLKILLLQNNLIPKIENIKRLKSLIYLNLALNNLTSISPEIGSLEKLRKLDLTMNFLDVDALENSVGALAQLEHLEDLYLTGNPVTQHAHYRAYVVHRLPHLAKLDGEEVSTGERIRARQMWPEVEREVHAAAAAMRAEKQTDAAALAAEESRPDGKDDDDLAEEAEAAGKTPEEAYMERAKKVTAYTPEARTQMVKEQEEMEQKKEEERRRARSGKDREDPWRDAQKKLNTKVDVSTLGDELPRQRNLGKLEFTVQETPLSVVYDIAVPRFMDTSLLDVDVHPRWFQLQCKGSLLLLHFPEEVEVAQTKLQRIQNTGHLLITCKKVRKLTQSAAGVVPSQKLGEDGDDEDADAELAAASAAVVPSSTTSSSSSSSSSGSTVLDFSSGTSSSLPRRAGGGSTLNMVTADYRHIARPKAASSGAAMRELTAVRSATLEEKRRLDAEQAAKERREHAMRQAGVDPEEERRELERLGLDDTGVPDLE